MSAEGASEIFKVFCRTAAYDVIFSVKFQGGGGQLPQVAPHLRAPMAPTALAPKRRKKRNNFRLRLPERVMRDDERVRRGEEKVRRGKGEAR